MKRCKYNSYSRQSHFRLYTYRYAAAVVRYADDIALPDIDLDMVAEAGERLVDGVVHDFVHQMVQAARPGGADIHARALADGLEALQHLDLAAVVFMLRMLLF